MVSNTADPWRAAPSSWWALAGRVCLNFVFARGSPLGLYLSPGMTLMSPRPYLSSSLNRVWGGTVTLCQAALLSQGAPDGGVPPTINSLGVNPPRPWLSPGPMLSFPTPLPSFYLGDVFHPSSYLSPSFSFSPPLPSPVIIAFTNCWTSSYSYLNSFSSVVILVEVVWHGRAVMATFPPLTSSSMASPGRVLFMVSDRPCHICTTIAAFGVSVCWRIAAWHAFIPSQSAPVFLFVPLSLLVTDIFSHPPCFTPPSMLPDVENSLSFLSSFSPAVASSTPCALGGVV